MANSRNGINYLSLCSGYDGIGQGLGLAGVRIAFTIHVEVETFAAQNLANKIQTGAMGPGIVYPDIKTFPFGKFRGGINLLSAGFPCQPFSHAGRGDADKDPRHLFPFIKRGIEALCPDWVMLENVDGIASKKLKAEGWNDPPGTPVLLHVLRELERAGYQATWGTFSAAEVGAPHLRKRIFILAKRLGPGVQPLLDDDCTEPGFPFSGLSWPTRPGHGQWWWEPPRVLRGGELDDPLYNEVIKPEVADTTCNGDRGEHTICTCSEGKTCSRREIRGLGEAGNCGSSGKNDELVNSEHVRLYEPTVRGCSEETSQDNQKGEDVSGESPRNGRPGLLSDIPGRKLADTQGGNAGQSSERERWKDSGRRSQEGIGELVDSDSKRPCDGQIRRGRVEESSGGRKTYSNNGSEIEKSSSGEGQMADSESERLEGLRGNPGQSKISKSGNEGQSGIEEIQAVQYTDREQEDGEAVPEVGGDSDASPCRMGYADMLDSAISEAVNIGDDELIKALEQERFRISLSRSFDSRVDELRLLGNGVVPPCAAKAFTILYKELTKEVEDE